MATSTTGEGKKAPAFSLDTDSGETVTLKSFAGKFLVLYFYPRDDTPGCTREAIAFNEQLRKIKALGAEIVGVSKDSIQSHCGFRDKYGLKFPLASDPDLAVHKAYGAWGEKTMYGKKVKGTIRSTYVVTPEGKIGKVFSPVKVDGHAEKVLEAIKSLAKG
jgi:peroxiredoxin Q/BCP